jgi:hypothetical protein
MSNKSKNRSKVSSINSTVADYQSALELFRSYPTMPTYCRVLEAALNANIEIENLIIELKPLAEISNEQYYCAQSSDYLRKNSALRRSSGLHFPVSMSCIETSNILWEVFSAYKSDDLWGYENYLVGEADYMHLEEQFQVQVEIDTPTNSTNFDRTEIQKVLEKLLSSIDESEKASESLQKIAETLGFKMIPWGAWAMDILENRQDFKSGLLDFSDYLASYFQDDVDENSITSSNSILKKKISQENAKSLVKIVSFLLFNPVIKEARHEEQPISLDDFWIERLVNYSEVNDFADLEDKVEYILAISNYLMMCAKFGINCVFDEFVTFNELKRGFLQGCSAEYLDTACLALLPPSGFQQTIISINAFEGDREGDYFLEDILRVTDYGVTGIPEKIHLDKIYLDGFHGMDIEVIKLLRKKTEKNIRKWIIPLAEVNYFQHLYEDFWEDEIILDKISNSLILADRESHPHCQFSSSTLENLTLHPQTYDESYHPALFARKFSNKIDFSRFEENEWINFAKSLNSVGQKRFSCVLMALYFTRAGYEKFYNVNQKIKFNIPEWVKLLESVQSLNSFTIVQQAISDMFDLYDDIPVVFRGSFQEFTPNEKTKTLRFDVKKGDRYSLYKNNLISAGVMLDKLILASQDSLVKGYTLTRDKDLAIFDLNSAALQNYFLAVEGELRSRLVGFDAQLIEELQHFKIDIDSIRHIDSKNRMGHIRGLFGIILLLENFTKFSESSRRKLIKIAPLAVHENSSIFLDSLRKFRDIRNSVQHADQSSISSGDLMKLIITVEKLLFEEGQIINILCKTKK